jgi:hypothetical protein
MMHPRFTLVMVRADEQTNRLEGGNGSPEISALIYTTNPQNHVSLR